MDKKKQPGKMLRVNVADNPISRNLYAALRAGKGFDENILILENNGITRHVVYSWVNGNRQPLVDSLKKVANILKFDLNKWFTEPQANHSNEIAPVCGNESKN